jgi:hypothetical protein
MKPESVVILKHYKRNIIMLVCVSKQASQQVYSWLAQFVCFQILFQNCVFAVGDKERGSKNQTLCSPRRKGKEICQTNYLSPDWHFLITLPSGLPFWGWQKRVRTCESTGEACLVCVPCCPLGFPVDEKNPVTSYKQRYSIDPESCDNVRQRGQTPQYWTLYPTHPQGSSPHSFIHSSISTWVLEPAPVYPFSFLLKK